MNRETKETWGYSKKSPTRAPEFSSNGISPVLEEYQEALKKNSIRNMGLTGHPMPLNALIGSGRQLETDRKINAGEDALKVELSQPKAKIDWNRWEFNPEGRDCSEMLKPQEEKRQNPGHSKAHAYDNFPRHESQTIQVDSREHYFKQGQEISKGPCLDRCFDERQREQIMEAPFNDTASNLSNPEEEFKSECPQIQNQAFKKRNIFSELPKPHTLGEATLLTSILSSNTNDNPSNPRPEPQSIDMIPCEFCGKEVKFSQYTHHTAKHISRAARTGNPSSRPGNFRIGDQNGFRLNVPVASENHQGEGELRRNVEREVSRGSGPSNRARNSNGNREISQENRRGHIAAGGRFPNISNLQRELESISGDRSEGQGDEESFRAEGSFIRNGNNGNHRGDRNISGIRNASSEAMDHTFDERRLISPLDILAMLLNDLGGPNRGASAPRGGLKTEEIELFNKVIFNSKMQEGNCSICLMNFSEAEELRFLGCFHRFHAQCIDVWLAKRRTCPECKRDVREMIREGDRIDNSEGE